MSRHIRRPDRTTGSPARRGVILAGGVAVGVAAPFTLFKGIALAGNSAPVPTNTDLSTFTVKANDGLTAFVRNPSLSITTKIDKTIVASGSTVTFTYVVSDNGDTGFKNVSVTDDNCAPITGGAAVLLPGDTVNFTCTTNAATELNHQAQVSGTPIIPSATTSTTTTYKDGTYTGAAAHVVILPGADEYDMQATVTIAGGKITDVSVPNTFTAMSASYASAP